METHREHLILVASSDNGFRMSHILFCEEILYKDKIGRWYIGTFSPEWVAIDATMNQEVINRIYIVKAKSWLLKHR